MPPIIYYIERIVNRDQILWSHQLNDYDPSITHKGKATAIPAITNETEEGIMGNLRGLNGQVSDNTSARTPCFMTFSRIR